MPDSAATARPRVRACVVIATFNGASVIHRQLMAVASQHTEFDWECVVADNGSSDSTLEVIRSLREAFPAPLIIVDASARSGVPYARNCGVAATSAELIIFCDQDDIVQPGWLAAAEQELRTADAVMGLIRRLNPEGTKAGQIMNPSVFTDLPIVESCNFGLKREVLLSVGGFDEGLPQYGMDDSELSLRLRKAGFRIVGCTQMEIWAQYSTEIFTRMKKVFSSGRAEIYVWSKHSDIYSTRLTYRYIIWDLLHSLRSLTGAVLKRRPPAPAARRVLTAFAHLWEMPRVR